MVWLLYNLFLPVYLVVSLPSFLAKARKRGGYRGGFWQRFGCYDGETRARLNELSGAWWIHAVSVGEVMVAAKLIDETRRQRPDQAVVLSTTTTTGHAAARARLPADVPILYHPLDLPPVLWRAFRALRPAQVILTESEIWPNLIRLARRRGIPVSVINARLSPRSAARYRRFRFLMAPILRRLSRVFTQVESDKTRWRGIGVPSTIIENVGSVKFDPEADQERATRSEPEAILRGLFGEARRVYLLLGSSHAGEEKALAEVFLRLRTTFPDLTLLLVPRHFERAPEILADLAPLNLTVERRSLWPNRLAPDRVPDALLIDSTGELRSWYALADLVVMGKSFLGVGGQNPVEPILAGKPVFFGPRMENFLPLADELVAAGGAKQAGGFGELENLLVDHLINPAEGPKMARAGCSVLALHRGATLRTVHKLLELQQTCA